MEKTPRPEELLAHRDFVRRLARGLVRADQVDDVVQETFVAALRRPPRRETLRAWLATVARNASRTVLRKQARQLRHERAAARAEGTASAADAVSRVELHGLVVQEVLALAEPYRLAVILRFFENLPPREIARRTATPVGTVRVRLRRALEQLRGRMDRRHGGDRRAWSLALVPLAGLDRPAAAAALTTGAAIVSKKTAAVVVTWAVVATGLFVHAKVTQRAAPPPRVDVARDVARHEDGVDAPQEPKRELTASEEMAEFQRRWIASRTGDIVVQLVDKEREPLEVPVTVTLEGTLPDKSTVTYDATSDAEGRVAFSDVRYPLQYRVRCVAEAGVDERARLWIEEVGKPLELRVNLRPRRPAVRATLRDTEGAPIAGGTVFYTTRVPGIQSRWVWGRLETNRDGRVEGELERLLKDTEELRVAAAAPGHLPGFGTATRDEHGDWTVEAQLQPGPVVRGILRDHDGKPLADHEIRFYAKRTYPIGERPDQPDNELCYDFAISGFTSSRADREVQIFGVPLDTDAEGRFEGWFAFVPEEAYIEVRRKDARTWKRSIEVRSVVDLGPINLPPPAPALALRVVNEKGEPMPGAYVIIGEVGWTQILLDEVDVTADEKGILRTFELDAGKTYEARVVDKKRGGQGKATFVAADGAEIRYEPVR
jgi:RNA polymerase sigma-70 factor (ECF subfamily)